MGTRGLQNRAALVIGMGAMRRQYCSNLRPRPNDISLVTFLRKEIELVKRMKQIYVGAANVAIWIKEYFEPEDHIWLEKIKTAWNLPELSVDSSKGDKLYSYWLSKVGNL
jgi:hypothetical protein